MDERYDDDVLRVSAALELLTEVGPPVGFTGADVVAAGRRRQRNRRGLTAVAAAATAAVGVATAILVPSLTLSGGSGGAGGAGGSGGAPAAGAPTVTGPRNTTAAATPARQRSDPTVPGLSPTEAVKIARGCATAFGDLATPKPGAGRSTGPPQRSGSSLSDQVRAYNVIRDAAGMLALVYAPTAALACDVNGPVMSYNAAGGRLLGGLEWLPGPVGLDFVGDTAGGRLAGKYPKQRGYALIAGRVTSKVVRVSVSYDKDHVTVRPVNGTYLVRFVHSVDWQIPVAPRSLRIAGYDAAGGLVAEVTDATSTCYLKPDGTFLGADGSLTTTQRCLPAVPWR